jgi:hypothetical protein
VFDPRQGLRISPLPSASRPALGPTQPPVQWVPGALSPGVERGQGVMLTTHPLLVPRLRESRSYTSCRPNAPLCSVTGPLYLYLYMSGVRISHKKIYRVKNMPAVPTESWETPRPVTSCLKQVYKHSETNNKTFSRFKRTLYDTSVLKLCILCQCLKCGSYVVSNGIW